MDVRPIDVRSMMHSIVSNRPPRMGLLSGRGNSAWAWNGFTVWLRKLLFRQSAEDLCSQRAKPRLFLAGKHVVVWH